MTERFPLVSDQMVAAKGLKKNKLARSRFQLSVDYVVGLLTH